MDTRTFLGLEATHNRFRWKLPVTSGLVTPMGFLYGGVGLAAAIEAMESTSGRPCVWATAQYLTYALTGRTVDIDVRLAVEGHHITQARAVCHVEDTEVLTVNAALGEHPFDREGQFEAMPDDVPPPDACPKRIGGADLSGSVFARMEQRIARGRNIDELDGTPGDGRSQMWARIPEVTAGIDAAALAVLGDYVPVGVSQALGIRGGGNSLDNTLRIVRTMATPWVLLDIHLQAVERGFGHGVIHMFATDGTLLATASQSCIARYWPDAAPDRSDRSDQRRT